MLGPSPLRLNVGAGAARVEGWLSVDLRPDVSDVVADARRLPFPDGAADEILASDVLEHFPLGESYPLLAEWRRVLKPGGLLTLRLPNLLALAQLIVAGSAERAIVNIYGGHRWGPDGAWDTHHTGWTPAGIEQLLRHAGYHVESNDGAPNMTVRARNAHAHPRIRRLGHARRVSVIVSASGGVVDLFHCLTALAAHPPCEEFETVVVDDGEDPGISELLGNLEGDVVILERPVAHGPAQKGNAAAAAASGELLVFLESGVEVTPGWGASVLAALDSDGQVGLVLPALADPRLPSGYSLGATVTACPFDEMLMAAPLDGAEWPARGLVAPTAAMALRRSCLDSAGGFDGGFVAAMHQAALAAAVRRQGWRTVCLPGTRLKLRGPDAGIDGALGTYGDRARFTQLWGQSIDAWRSPTLALPA
jgi:SAM-dependent methyltransferase